MIAETDHRLTMATALVRTRSARASTFNISRPTPEGMPVEISAKITAIDRHAVTFEAVVRDVLDEVGRCTHQRFIVDLDKLRERLCAKIVKAR
jgi:predicted thioesterase